jgi:group II intron reverse transcriptase/maturase
VHLSGNFSSEAELKEKQDFMYRQSKLGKVFHGILEVATNKITIITAIHKIKSNKGANTAGIDRQKMNRYLQMDTDELIELVKNSMYSYKARPVRRVYIQKSNGKLRPLGIPTILDRIIQQCLKLVIEPIAEARFYPQSYGFRPYRGTTHAMQEMFQLCNSRAKEKPYYCIEGDIKGYFDNINHRLLLQKLWRIGVHDKRIIAIVAEMLRAGYFEQDALFATEKGTPQGGILSPLLANIYLNDFDWFIGRMYHYPFQRTALLASDRIRLKYNGVIPKFLIRYADDWIILTPKQHEAQRLYKNLLKYFKHKLKVELSEEKTLITDLREHYVNFLGFRMLTEQKRLAWNKPTNEISVKTYPNPNKVNKQIRVIRDEIAKLYNIRRPLQMAIQIERINMMIIGAAEYWKYVLSSKVFHKIDYAINKKAYEVFRKIYGVKTLQHNVPLNSLHNRRDRHKGHIDTSFAVNIDGMWIGFTKAYLTGSAYLKGFYDQKVTPYSQDGRELYQKKLKRQLPKDRPTLYNDADILYKSMNNKLYNFEYFMNREYAFNRDKGKCKCCETALSPGNGHCHHVNNRLPITEINKVPNLAWLCVDCHQHVHGKETPDTLPHKTKKKLQKYILKLTEIL